MVDAKANSYVEASLNNTIPGSWLALVAGTKAYRFESCPDYGEIAISQYGIQSVNLENLLDSWKDSKNGLYGGRLGVSPDVVDAIQRRKCSNTEGHSKGMQEAKT